MSGPLPVTPSQTVGPFFVDALSWPEDRYVVPVGTPGAVWLRGVVLDGAGEPVPDALVETWQADPDGRFDHPDDPRGQLPPTVAGFRGFGRCPTDPAGRYGIHTVKPGPLPGPPLPGPPRPGAQPTVQAPHLDVSVFARGLLVRVVTRVYFADEAAANAADPVLAALPDDRDRATLLAERSGDGYRFDIRLQGEHETVFFAV